MTIRRPLYYISIAFAAAILVRHYFGAGVAGGMTAGLAIVWRMSEGSGCRGWRNAGIRGADWQSSGRKRLGMQRRTALPLMILLSFSAGLASVLICDHHLAADPVRACFGQEAVMVGVVRQPEYYRDSKGQRLVRIETELKAIGEERVGEGASKILLTADLEDAGDAGRGPSLAAFPPGSVIRFSGELKEPEGKRNPNCFDYKLYLKTRGIQATVRTEDLEVLALRLRELREWNESAGRVAPTGAPTLAGRLFLLRERYLERIEANAGEETAGLIRAMLFGQKGELDDDVEEVFQHNGTAHILAVSGLHVGMLYGAACLLWDLLAGMAPGAFGARRGKRFS